MSTIVDLPHAFRDCLILNKYAADPGETLFASLGIAIDVVIIPSVVHALESVVPARRVRDRLGHRSWPAVHATGVSGDAVHRVGQCMTVVHRYPGSVAHFQAEDACWDHGVKREKELGDAPVRALFVQRTEAAVHRANLGVYGLVTRR